MMTDTNGHSNDVEDDRDGDSGGGQKLMELLNSQLQNAVKLEERYNNLKKQYDSLLKTKVRHILLFSQATHTIMMRNTKNRYASCSRMRWKIVILP